METALTKPKSPAVPGTPKGKGQKGRGRGDGSGGGKGPPEGAPKGICFEFRDTGKRSKPNCPYEHRKGGGGKQKGGKGGAAKGGKGGGPQSSGVDSDALKLCQFF